MKQLSLLIIIFLIFSKFSYATHIAGGEVFYQYLGPGSTPNTSKYRITMRLFRECNPPPTENGSAAAPLNGERVTIGVYATNSLNLIDTVTLVQQFTSSPLVIQNTPGINPCLTGNPIVCYQVGIYVSTIELSNSADGYILSWVRYTRTTTIQNASIGGSTGATFTTQIPGTNKLPFGNNNSPQFAVKDTSIVCRQTGFSLDYSATDSDSDSLAYKFAAPYDGPVGGTSTNGYPNPNPKPDIPNLQLQSLNFVSPYTALTPLGNAVNLNSSTGIISGIAPASGRYVLCVIAEEWRNGVLINSHRKDFILIVNDCSLSGASLSPTYLNCNDLTFNFSNQSTSSNIVSYLWTFGEPSSGAANTSTQPTPTHIYKDTGVYITKLKVVASGGCIDSATTQVGVFPGFVAKFKVDGSCLINPYQFTDLTVSKYGIVSNWKWDFGEVNINSDTSLIKNPQYLYPSLGAKTATLTVSDTKGCQSTFTETFTVLDRPSINLAFKDTLICSIDTLQLFANSNGIFSWMPNSSSTISNPNISNPLVYPKDTTTYYVTVNYQGCINTDSVRVNVLDFITVNAGLDTAICKTDTIRLHPVSDGLSYAWKSSTGVPVSGIKYPLVAPLVNTDYYVLANLGKCQASDSVSVFVNPYPIANAGADATICFGNKVQLNANIVSSSFIWSPQSSLLNANTLSPIAGPSKTTTYTLTVQNNTGCLKPVTDSIVINVTPIVAVNAGHDTSVVINQPLQLTASSNTDSLTTSFLWLPSSWLNNNKIYNPIATFTFPIDSIKYKVRATTPQGCFGEDDILVRVYKTDPDIFVPSAFTPNSDGRNDVLKAIPIGIKQFNYFNVYNRYGQLLYSSPEIGKGWDGNFGGSSQPAGTYVYMTQGIDYLGNTIFRKGTAVLIR